MNLLNSLQLVEVADGELIILLFVYIKDRCFILVRLMFLFFYQHLKMENCLPYLVDQKIMEA